MLTNKRRITTSIVLTVATISIFLYVISCSNSITKNESTQENSKSYQLTIHEEIILEYQKRYNKDHYEQIFRDFIQEQNSLRSKVDANEVIKFIVDNLHLFADSTLYAEVEQTILEHHGISGEMPFPATFTNDFKKCFLDYEGKYGGINLLQLVIVEVESDDTRNVKINQELSLEASIGNSLNEVKILFDTEIRQNLNNFDIEHYESFFKMVVNNASTESIITHLSIVQDNGDFSTFYNNNVDFAMNTFLFYESGDAIIVGGGGITSRYIATVDAIGQAVACALYSGCGLGPNNPHKCGPPGARLSAAVKKLVDAIVEFFNSLYNKLCITN